MIGEHITQFFCATCHASDAPAMTPAEAKEHMVKVHNVTKFTGRRKLALAADGDFYENTYEIEIKGIKLIQFSRGPARHH